jgi:hypothetical protein
MLAVDPLTTTAIVFYPSFQFYIVTIMSIVEASFPTSFVDTTHASSIGPTGTDGAKEDEEQQEHDDGGGIASTNEEKTQENPRRAELRIKREECMTSMKQQLEKSLMEMQDTAKCLLNEIGTYVQVTHDVMYSYEQVLESQQTEAQRLEDVSKSVVSATNPFLNNAAGNNNANRS